MPEEATSEAEFQFDDLVMAVSPRIKDLLLNRQVAPGAMLRQEELAKSLGVSRTRSSKPCTS